MNTIKLTYTELGKVIRECVERILSESQYAGLDDVVSGEELSDAAIREGFKLIGYHNTNFPNLKRFYNRSAGIHFGSLKAANDRGEMRDCDEEGKNWTNKYFLKVENPLVIEKDFDWEMESFDEWNSPDDDRYFDSINIFAYFEKELGWDIYEKDIKDIIREHGYDCIIYKNEREDVGNYSIAMFNPNNIKLACKTIDNQGNPIPLRERFNTNTNDVRY